MSLYLAHAEDFCGLCCATTRARLLVVEAIDDNASYVHAASPAELDEAVHALESCRLHDCDAHKHEDQALALLAERKCAHCGVWVAGEELVDVAELVPLSGPVCEDCEHELVAELHDDDACDCASCSRARSKADRAAREAEAGLRGGLRPGALALLGLDREDL